MCFVGKLQENCRKIFQAGPKAYSFVVDADATLAAGVGRNVVQK